MTDTHQFPTIDQLDGLRAGLLDDQPELKAKVEAALRRHPELAAQLNVWDRCAAELTDASSRAVAINNRLRLLRREAICGRTRRVDRFQRAPVLTASALAGMMLVVGLGVFLTREATTTLPTAENVATNLSGTTEPPDLADNLDFYAWLESQPAVAEGRARGI